MNNLGHSWFSESIGVMLTAKIRLVGSTRTVLLFGSRNTPLLFCPHHIHIHSGSGLFLLGRPFHPKHLQALIFMILFTVAPHVPVSLKLKDINSTVVILFWHLPGNFAKINLLCQIEIRKTNSEQEVVRKILL